MHYVSLISTIITAAFAAAVLSRYRYKKGNHLLFWGVGLIFYGVGTLTEVILGLTYSTPALKAWYLSGAMLTAAWLGQGTIFLLVRKRGAASTLAGILLLASILALGMVIFAPVSATVGFNVNQPISTQYQAILERSGPMVILTILLNIYGTLGLIGGAIYSSFLFWRKKVLASRMTGNLLIAAGALMPAMAGSFVKAGLVDWLYVSELLGVILMFIGFLQATSGKAPAVNKASISSPTRV